MHKRMRRPPVIVSPTVKIESTCIFHRKHRLGVRRKLLLSIVLGCDGSPSLANSPINKVVIEPDSELARRLEEALLDPHPQPHTDVARIWLRYSFHVADYFQSDRIAPIQPALLDRVSRDWLSHERCRAVWEDSLESSIRKSYNRYVKTAALDFILTDGSTTSWTLEEDRLLLMSSCCPRTTERHRPMILVQRSIGRKLCIHHFYGRKFVALWYKFIRFVYFDILSIV